MSGVSASGALAVRYILRRLDGPNRTDHRIPSI
jgi:hypothetical protein